MATLAELLTAAAVRTSHTEDEITALLTAFEAADGAEIKGAIAAMGARCKEVPPRSAEATAAFQALNLRLAKVPGFYAAIERLHHWKLVQSEPLADRPLAERPLHPDLVHAIDQLDAALFNGDAFDGPVAHAHMRRMLARWTRQLGEAPPQGELDDGDVPA